MELSDSPRLPRKRRLRMLLRTLRDLYGERRAGTHPPLSADHLPRTHGRLEVVRDARGVPHVYAEDERDLYLALGYLQAADRFVLLDVVRHLGGGRLCELVGNLRGPADNEVVAGRRVADLDRFLRPLEFEHESRRDLPRLGERARGLLLAFADGVNAALRAMRGVYPTEYLLVGRVRKWAPEDCLLMARTSAFVVSLVNLENELTFDAVRAEVGDDLARRIYPDAPWENVPKSYEALGAAPPEAPVHVPSAGSNNWAVGAGRSRSGAPIVANDPHVPLFPLPTYWYHVHLEGPRHRVQGGVFPGCPVFGFGHNGSMAWGCTTGFRDGWDLYRIHRLPGDPARYRVPGGEGRIERRSTRIRVRLGRDVDYAWERCEHGVLLPDWKHHDGTDLAVRFVPADLAHYFEGYLGLAEATTVEEHRKALALVNDGPFDFNHVYGHRDGHIGWELFGLLPRRKADGLFVRDAHDPEAQWDGFVPFDEMPKRLDPPEGFVASANSIVDRDDHARIASLAHFEPRYRQERIEQTLAARDDHDVASSCALQSDVEAHYAPPLRDALLALLPPLEGDDPRLGRARDLLAAWDGAFPVGSQGASLFFFTQRELVSRCFLPLLGKAGHRYCIGRRAVPRLQRMLLDGSDPLRADVEARAGRPLEELARDSLRAAVARVSGICGADPENWQWGRIQRARLGTLLAEIPRLGKRFLALDAPFPGDDYTVSPSRALEEKRRLRAFVGASSRFVCDLGRPDEALYAHSSGPRADVGSAFYDNLSEAWSRFEYFSSALWPADAVPDPVERIVLGPGRPSETR